MRVNHYWLLLLSLLAVACVKDNTSSTDAPSEESIYYDVSLNFGGEITVEDAPLTRGTPTNDIYGINVYVDNDGDGSITDHYAYGLFDNKEDMTIPLLSGYKYRFECTLIKEAKKLFIMVLHSVTLSLDSDTPSRTQSQLLQLSQMIFYSAIII